MLMGNSVGLLRAGNNIGYKALWKVGFTTLFVRISGVFDF